MEPVSGSIDPQTTLGVVTLAVRDAERSLAFYRDLLGFELLDRDDGTLLLGAGDNHILTLHASPHNRPRPAPTTGLYHVAVLLPSRPELARVLRRLIDARIPLGSADHAVSEALYLGDPDGNGLEIYRDRSPETWRWNNGQVRMTTERLDAAGILRELPQTAARELPAATTIGHVHLQVADLAAAERFYHQLLGFDITAGFPGALFVSAGGYHHHLGLNTWESLAAPEPPPDATGLRSFEVVVPNRGALDAVLERLAAGGFPTRPGDRGVVVDDPWHNSVVLRTTEARSEN